MNGKSQQRNNKVLFVDDKVQHDRNVESKAAVLPAVQLLGDSQLITAIEQHRDEARAIKKHRRLRVLIAELVWNTYMNAWVEVTRGFCVEENWPEGKGNFKG